MTVLDQQFAANTGESARRMCATVRHMNSPLLVLLDSHRHVFRRSAVKLLPSSYLLDAQGRIRFVPLGSLE